jgi:hypothetical protein
MVGTLGRILGMKPGNQQPGSANTASAEAEAAKGAELPQAAEDAAENISQEASEAVKPENPAHVEEKKARLDMATEAVEAEHSFYQQEQQDKGDTKDGIVRRMISFIRRADTKIRGRELDYVDRVVEGLTAIGLGAVAELGDASTFLAGTSIPVLGWIGEWATDVGITWAAEEINEFITKSVARVRKKEVPEDVVYSGVTARLLSKVLSVPASLLAPGSQEFINPVVVQSLFNLGGLAPVSGAVVERIVTTSDSAITRVQKIFRIGNKAVKGDKGDRFGKWVIKNKLFGNESAQEAPAT